MKNNERILNYLRDKSGFEIKNIIMGNPVPEGMTSEILWNIWDIGLKFGQQIPKGLGFKMTFGEISLLIELYGFRGNDVGGKDGFVVSRLNGTKFSTVESPIYVELSNNLNLMWSKKITSYDALRCIEEIDRIAIKNGDMKDGIRIMRQPVIIPSIN